jgi:hypothetical protein
LANGIQQDWIDMGKIGTLKRHWFLRGLAVGFILVAAANASSYFFRSEGWTDLIGATANQSEAIGFPFELWRENQTYDGWMIDLKMTGLNGAVALLFGSAIGILLVLYRGTFNRWIEEFENDEDFSKLNQPLKIQFSLKGMLIAITAISVIAAIINTWGACPEVLAAIYFLGPLALVALAMTPGGIKWEHRVVILLILAVAMLVAVVVAGIQMGMDIDRVLFGIFLCWTPQSALAALVLTCGLVVQRMRRSEPQPANQ